MTKCKHEWVGLGSFMLNAPHINIMMVVLFCKHCSDTKVRRYTIEPTGLMKSMGTTLSSDEGAEVQPEEVGIGKASKIITPE